MRTKPQNLVEWSVLGAFTLFLLIVPAGITVGLRTTLATLFTVFGSYQVLRGRCSVPHLLIPISAWVFITMVSSMWSWGPQETLRSAAYDTLLPTGTMLAAWYLARNKNGTTLWIMVLAGAQLVAVAGIGVIVLTGVTGLYEPALRKGILAAYPGVGVSTTIAILVLPFCLAGLLQTNRPIRIMSIISLCAITVIGLISQNRAFWPALLLTAGAQVVLILHRRPQIIKKCQWKLFFAAMCSVVVLLAGWHFTLSTRFSAKPGIDGTILSITRDIRWAAWQIWFEKGSERPLLGFGYGKRLIPVHIEPVYRKKLATLGEELTGHAHNLLLNVWLQTGVIGLITLISLFAALARHLLSSPLKVRSNHLSGATIGICLLVGLLAKNMTDDFFDHALALYFWTLMGIALGLHEAEIHRNRSTASPHLESKQANSWNPSSV
jgi:O-antigen ligase